MKLNKLFLTPVLVLAAATAVAKLPPLSDEAKAKAAETAAKNAWNDKVAAFQLCKSMDKVAAGYLASAKKQGKDLKPTATPACADPGAFVYPPPAAASGATATAAAPAAVPAPAPKK